MLQKIFCDKSIHYYFNMDRERELKNLYKDLPIKIRWNSEVDKTLPPCSTYEDLNGKIKTEFNITQIDSIEYMNDFGETRAIVDKNSYIKALKKSNGQYHYFMVSSPKEHFPYFSQYWHCMDCKTSNHFTEKNCSACIRKNSSNF